MYGLNAASRKDSLLNNDIFYQQSSYSTYNTYAALLQTPRCSPVHTFVGPAPTAFGRVEAVLQSRRGFQ